MNNKELITELKENRIPDKEDLKQLLTSLTKEDEEFLYETARKVREDIYGKDVYVRGLIEFTNYCRNDCTYCGIRASNKNALRYRLTREEILQCCEDGYALGFRTFVLQGGEDESYSDEDIVEIVRSIKAGFPDCAVTLSIGEKSRASYLRFFEAGADRYLLRHETADYDHYRRLHPPELSPEHRRECLWNLKEIGYQVGTGFMVGAPGQTAECLAEDMLFIRELEPHMVGIGPFVPHHETPLAKEPGGSVELTLWCIGVLRLMLPQALIPATTALGTIAPDGREQGILAGANVVMPNLSPVAVRKKYELYDNKICTGEEAAECRFCLAGRMERIGYHIAVSRGDHPSRRKEEADV